MSIDEKTREALYRSIAEGDIDAAIRAVNAEMLKEGASLSVLSQNVGALLADLYNDFFIAQVHGFLENLADRVSKEFKQSLLLAVNPIIDLTKKYNQRLEDLSQERLSREIREHIRSKDFKSAADCAFEILKRARTKEDLLRLGSYIGGLTGSLIHDQKGVEAMFSILGKTLSKAGAAEDVIINIEAERKKRFDTIHRSRMENQELDWNRLIIETIVEIKGKLPDRFKMGEPTEEQMSIFRDILCSILRVPFFKNNESKWLDVINILVDFTPRELGGLASLAGAEQRAYNALGLTAKRVVNRNFERVGKQKLIQNAFLKLAEQYQESPYFERIIQMLGALRSPAFYPFLKSILSQKKYKPMRGTVIEAIGQVSGLDSRTQLLELLAENCRGLIDPPKVREINRILVALGKITRHPNITDQERNDIVNTVIKTIPKQERQLALAAATQLFSFKTDALDDEQIAWAASSLTDGLWLTDDKPEFAKGEERQQSLLGFREEMANTLVAIGQRGLPEIIKTAEQNSGRYSGAFLALGEVFAKIGDESVIPLVDKLLVTCFLTDETSINKYHKELYWDTAEEKKKPLDKDKLISSMLFAVKKIGGKKADDLLYKIYKQVQAGSLPSLGSESAKILVDANMKRAPDKPADENAEPEPFGEKSITMSPGIQIADAIDALKSRYFLKSKDTKRREKIKALQTLGTLKPVEAVKLILKELEESDMLIRSAAISALMEYGSINTPPQILKNFIYAIFEYLPNCQVEVKAEIIKILIKLNPARKDIYNALKFLEDTEIGKKSRMDLDRLIRNAEEAMSQSSTPFDTPENTGGDATGKPEIQKTKPPETISELEKKRIYLEARRQWIAGGKKGTPPEPPK